MPSGRMTRNSTSNGSRSRSAVCTRRSTTPRSSGCTSRSQPAMVGSMAVSFNAVQREELFGTLGAVVAKVPVDDADSRRLLRELTPLLALVERFHGASADGDVAIDLQDARGFPVAPGYQHLPALHDDSGAVAAAVPQFAVPAPLAGEEGVDLGDGEAGADELVALPAHRLRRGPPVHLLGAGIPAGDDVGLAVAVMMASWERLIIWACFRSRPCSFWRAVTS